MAFINQRLPEEVERGSSGGPSFSTTVATLSSGFEKRNINWSASRQQFDIGYGIQSKEDFSEVLAFFYVCNGRAHSFRFKDWGDYVIGNDEADSPQEIGTGDGADTTFQIVKRYTVGATTHEREITKPVNGTVRAFVNFVEKTEGADYTVNYLTGLITFTVFPPAAQSVGVICEFDVAVRFDVDNCDVTLETFQAGAVPSLPLIEVRSE
jgi:uncharacterized protein (TIGR02217 family)